LRFALINPAWSFEGSIYFGCREPHLPLEFGYAKALLERAGHDALIVDGQLGAPPGAIDTCSVAAAVEDFRPDFAVVTTAPSYLFWRCAPPELRIPRETIDAIAGSVRGRGGKIVAVGPHASTTPLTTVRKLGADIAILGECEDILPKLAGDWNKLESVSFDGAVRGGPHATDMNSLPALAWLDKTIARHAHHHHRFEAAPAGPGAEVEFSRGCPYHCTFCAKENFRDDYRRRPLAVVLEEIDALLSQGVEYIYFIDEIFLPYKPLLEALAARHLKFGIQTRIDLWSCELIDLLGRAGCVSIEAGVESISEEGRRMLDKKCRLSTDDLAERLLYAKDRVPFVQANLLSMEQDDPAAIEAWRQYLIARGVWANEPVPLFSYPGSPEYTRRWGAPDENAWERAVDAYLGLNHAFSDIQEQRPQRLVQLETRCAC
jgi:B12-binding domain/radical SAM domain protein of rhizo-twelve system